MRYVLSTEDSEGLIGIQIQKWQKEGKLQIIEKSETLVELEAQMARVAKALEILKKAGYNSKVMKAWLHDQARISVADIDNLLEQQEEFFRQIGVLKR